jgi:hypothetical protein
MGLLRKPSIYSKDPNGGKKIKQRMINRKKTIYTTYIMKPQIYTMIKAITAKIRKKVMGTSNDTIQ